MICISTYEFTPFLQWSPGCYLDLGSWPLGPCPQNARQNGWWLVTCCSENLFLLLYLNQSKKEKQSLTCSTAHLALWINHSVGVVLDWTGAGTNVFQSKTLPSEDYTLVSLQHVLSGCLVLFESPGSLVMLSLELSGSSVTAAGAEFGLFGRRDLASSSGMMTMKPCPRCCWVWPGLGGRMIWHL